MNSHVTVSLVKDNITAYHKPCITIFHTEKITLSVKNIRPGTLNHLFINYVWKYNKNEK